MKHYYIVENDQQLGPFTIENLKSKMLRKSTLVWTDGMSDWVSAESIDELKGLLTSDPPPIRSSHPSHNTPQSHSTPPQQLFPSDFLSSSGGMLLGTIGVILFSLFNWVKITIYGEYSIKATLFNITKLLNNSEVRYFLDSSNEFTAIRIISVMLIIAMVLSFVLLIISLLMNFQLKPKPSLAYGGFVLCVIVATIFIVAMTFIYVEHDIWLLTVFPFLTLGTAIISMIFFVKQPISSQEIKKNVRQKTKPVRLRTLKNKYLYIIPGVILVVIYLRGLVLNLMQHIDFFNLFAPLIFISILGLALFYAYHSNWKTVWYVFAFTSLNIIWQFLGFVARIKIAKQHGIEIPVHFLTYLIIVLTIMLLVVALWDIFGTDKNKEK